MNDITNEEWISDYEHASSPHTPTPTVNQNIRPSPVSVTEEEIVITGDEAPLIPEGEYEATCLGSEILRSTPWGPKIRLTFRIQGQSDEVILTKHYNIKITGKSPVRGTPQWKAGTRTDYIRDHRRLFGKKRTAPLSAFRRRVFLVEVKTVIEDSKGHPLGEDNHYSKVARLIKLKE